MNRTGIPGRFRAALDGDPLGKRRANTPVRILGVLLILLLAGCAGAPRQDIPDPLPSWSEGTTRQTILSFVADVADPAHPDFVPAAERVAVFDNDGTLWSEKPTYFQLLFILDRIRAMAGDHPEWRSTQPFQAVLENDTEALAAAGREGMVTLAMTAQADLTTDEFAAVVADWTATAKHPVSGRAFTSMVFQPMLELLDYLRANGFSVYIVSGGGIDFMRPWVQRVYGVPPENVIGSSLELRYEMRGEEPVIVRESALHFINDKGGKPVGIQRFIGRRPILAAGNSDGDFEMLEWTTTGDGRRLGLLIHHTDAVREWAYDRESSEGRLDRALDAAPGYGWRVVDMARDWTAVYPSP
jgi:phosphoserine phosphatase